MKNPKELQEEFEEKYKEFYSLTRADDDKEYLYEDVEKAWQYYKESHYKEARAFLMLESLGVPRQRAHSVANGIDVYAIRIKREHQALKQKILYLEKKIEDFIECPHCGEKYPRGNLVQPKEKDNG